MKIPLRYNIRSLWVRRFGSALTVFGIGMTVAIVLTMMALVHGLDSTFVSTGHDNQLIVIRQGSDNEANSILDREKLQITRDLDGVLHDEENRPMVAGEILVIINHERVSGDTANVLIRGTSDMSFRLRPEVQIVRGRIYKKGLRELIVSESISRRFKGLSLGETVHIGRADWNIVGIFNSGGTAYDSEVWGDYDSISQEWDRPMYSSILLRAENAEASTELQKKIKDDPRFHLEAIDERAHFRKQTISSGAIKFLGFFIALIMGAGSAFAAMNMMYGQVMARFKEVGTLRAIGFRRRSIMASFLFESVVLAMAGGALGCLLALPVNGISTGTANFVTFSEVLFNFRITPMILVSGLIYSAFVGVAGGLLPARRASNIRLIDVLRD